MGTLNLCQKMSDKMQKDSDQSDHSILRKRPKCGENWSFWEGGYKEGHGSNGKGTHIPFRNMMGHSIK